MREIKFRTPWFSGGVFVGYTYWGYLDERNEFTAPASRPGYRREDDEQYTGLKDKNGREIYHNDLVKDQFGFVKRVESYFAEFILIDHDVSYKLMDYAKMDIPGIASNLEIIGNVHENKELLANG